MMVRLGMFLSVISLVLLLIPGKGVWAQTEPGCDSQLANCTRMVKPVLNDLRYMFPTTLKDVDEMCKMWSRFVECVRRYMAACFSEEQRSKFNDAVSNSIDTVHAICSSDRHQREYLENASCFKRVSIDNCGSYYRQLIEQVSNPRSHDEHICCSYGQFKNCVSEPLSRDCGSRTRALMDHSMTFLITRCGKTYYSLSYRCPTAAPPEISTTTISDNLIGTTQSPRRARTFGTLPPYTTYAPWTPRTVIYTLPPEPGSRTSRDEASLTHQISWILMTLGLIAVVMR